MRVRCNECNDENEFTLSSWRCVCGGAWEIASLPPFDITQIQHNSFSIWRYAKLLGLDVKASIKQMGVGWTPLVKIRLDEHNTYLKLEFLSPSASFKDRGVNTMVHQLVLMGAETLVEDSSGNAGASLAAHAAHFGIQAKIFVPEYAAAAKQHQISIYGAEVIPIKGPRKAAEDAAQAVIGRRCVYASHAYNPAYLAGQVTAAYELWEQLERKSPHWIICPVAQGGQLLGYWFGFRQLQQAGLVNNLPRLIAVQSERISPLYQAWSQGLDHIPAVQASGHTIAEGVAITQPVRGTRLLQAVNETNGKVIAIEEQAIISAQHQISNMGYYVEPTSALALAGYQKFTTEIDPNDIVVLSLTGSGLKGAPQNSEAC